MLVDDDYTVKMALEASLITMGYDVIGQADSGEQAVEMARDLKPDVILMDIVMPGHMDGITALRESVLNWMWLSYFLPDTEILSTLKEQNR